MIPRGDQMELGVVAQKISEEILSGSPCFHLAVCVDNMGFMGFNPIRGDKEGAFCSGDRRTPKLRVKLQNDSWLGAKHRPRALQEYAASK